MRLAEFITANMEVILAEWESFARAVWPPGAPADPVALRDSAEEILRAVVADMATAQSVWEQSEKSAGRGGHGVQSERLDHASQVHGAGRVGSGFALPAVVAEYRALRASVLRLWRASLPAAAVEDLGDVTRFNEAIDQSLTLAVGSFTTRLNTARNLFLGVLGHDLRNPLSAILLVARAAQAGRGDAADRDKQLSQIIESVKSTAELVTDLIDFASTSLGAGMPLQVEQTDLQAVCDAVMREARAGQPQREIRVITKGDPVGVWDAHRLRQMISNLVGNALQHGLPSGPVDVVVDGTAAEEVVLSVHNDGEPIPPEVLPTIFDPLVRGPQQAHGRRTGSVGLGLYIVREIATAHGGTAEVTSTATDGTKAVVRLSRHARG